MFRAIFVLLALVVGSASHASIVYKVDRSFKAGPGVFGSSGGVSGTITTDGTLGFLSESNIVDWKLELSAGSHQFDIDPGNSLFEYITVDPARYNHGLFASVQELEFRFGFSFSSLYTLFSFYGGALFSDAATEALPNFFTWCIGTNFCANDLGFADELIVIRDSAGQERRTTIPYGQDGREILATAVPVPAAGFLAAIPWLAAAGYVIHRRLRHG